MASRFTVKSKWCIETPNAYISKLIYYDDDVHCVNFDLHFFKFIHKKWRVVIYKTVYWRNTLHYFLLHNSACFHIFTMHSSWYKQEGVVGLLFLLLLTTMCFIENYIQKLYVLAGTWCSLHSTNHNNYIVPGVRRNIKFYLNIMWFIYAIKSDYYRTSSGML